MLQKTGTVPASPTTLHPVITVYHIALQSLSRDFKLLAPPQGLWPKATLFTGTHGLWLHSKYFPVLALKGMCCHIWSTFTNSSQKQIWCQLGFPWFSHGFPTEALSKDMKRFRSISLKWVQMTHQSLSVPSCSSFLLPRLSALMCSPSETAPSLFHGHPRFPRLLQPSHRTAGKSIHWQSAMLKAAHQRQSYPPLACALAGLGRFYTDSAERCPQKCKEILSHHLATQRPSKGQSKLECWLSLPEIPKNCLQITLMTHDGVQSIEGFHPDLFLSRSLREWHPVDIRCNKKLGMFVQRNPPDPTIQSVLPWQTTLIAAVKLTAFGWQS